jgi:hypothetical protein
MIVSTSRAKNFSGIHAPHLMEVFDEGSGIPEGVWIERLGSMTGEDVRFVSMDNPVSLTDRFGQFWQGLPGAARVQMSAFDYLEWSNRTGRKLPGCITPEWVKQMERWKGTAIWKSKVLGEFSSESEESVVIPYEWLKDCVGCLPSDDEFLRRVPIHRRSIGVDVARTGECETVIAPRYGPVLKPLKAYRGFDLMVTVGEVGMMAAKVWPTSPKRLVLNIDQVGMGAGVVDRLVELGYNACGVSGGDRASDPSRFFETNAEQWWHVRELAEETHRAVQSGNEAGLRLSIPNDPVLMAQLTTRRWHVRSEQQVMLERKPEMFRRGLPSPDRADATILAFKSDLKPAVVGAPATDKARFGAGVEHREAAVSVATIVDDEASRERGEVTEYDW